MEDEILSDLLVFHKFLDKIPMLLTISVMNVKNRTLFIADNLPILRGIDSETIDLIYLDPPFNSNRNYAAPIGTTASGAEFKDFWTLDDIKDAEHGEIADKNPALYQSISAAELTHSKSMKAYLIMMAVRLMEMHRILKPTGSIYLHCDPNASHYLKLLMDAIFGRNNFRNEIIWHRNSGRAKGSQHNPKKFGASSDHIFFYGMSKHIFNGYYEFREDQEKSYPKIDDKGRRFSLTPLWRGRTMGVRPNLCYTWRGYKNPYPSGWRTTKEKVEELYQQGRIYFSSTNTPYRIRYLEEDIGRIADNVWHNIPPTGSKERTGYPTQKPLALLDRIIKASSNENDVVLDPFCGCATTCIAAENLNRQWIRIDISPKAVELVKMRMERDLGLFVTGKLAPIHRTDIPKRTDIEKLPHYRTNKHALYGKQEGICNGCENHFLFPNLDVDHIIPKSKGGTDHTDNLQLLCTACNRLKSNGTMAELKTKLKKQD